MLFQAQVAANRLRPGARIHVIAVYSNGAESHLYLPIQQGTYAYQTYSGYIPIAPYPSLDRVVVRFEVGRTLGRIRIDAVRLTDATAGDE
jgi:hypothetical protein